MTPPLKSSLKDGKGNKVKFVKSQRLVRKVPRVQTKTPKHQPANDSEDDSNSSIGSDSSMSVEAAPRALIWRNDISSSKKGRKVSHLRNVSLIHSVRKSRRLSEKRDNDKPNSKASSEPEAVVPQSGHTAIPAPTTSSMQPTSSTQMRRIQRPAGTAETRRRREEEYHGYSQEEPRPRFENGHKSTPHLNPRGDITEDDVDNYLTRMVLSDTQHDIDATRSHTMDHRRVPGGKRTTTDEEDTFLQQSLRTPRSNIEC